MNPFDAGFTPPTDRDLDFLRLALGRPPGGVRFVAVRDGAGLPRVIASHPLQKGLPLPTTFWLVDAALSAELAALEAGGGVRAAERWLAAEPARAAAYADENRAYAAYRWGLLTAGEKAALAGSSREKVLRDSGIGGMAKHGRATPAVKCLHLQAAWALAYPQAVLGAWLFRTSLPPPQTRQTASG